MQKHIYLFTFFIISCSLQAQDQIYFNIENDGIVKVSGDVNIVLHNTTWVNNGAFNPIDGNVSITGDAVQSVSSIGGSNTTAFHNLTIDKSANNVQLDAFINVSHQLNLQTGLLDANGFAVNLGDDANVVNVPDVTWVKGGDLYRRLDMGEAMTYTVGNATYNPLVITNNGEASEFGVTVKDEVLTEGNSGTVVNTNVVNRSWNVYTNNNSMDVTLSPEWDEAQELTGFDRNNAYMSKYEFDTREDGSVSTVFGNNPYYMDGTFDFGTLSYFSVRSALPLALELLSFNAVPKDEQVQLWWQTTNEINTAHFDIEHSIDGHFFQKIGQEIAQGQATNITNYQFVHTKPVIGKNYYRLRQVNTDDTFTYSDIRSVIFHKDMATETYAYPNPATQVLYLNRLIEQGKYTLYNALGMQVQTGTIDGELTLDIQSLSAGQYWLQILEQQKSTTISFEKIQP